MKDGFVRVASAFPAVCVGDCQQNVKIISKMIKEAKTKGVELVNFPELSICGYTCGDLFLNYGFLEECLNGVLEIAKNTANLEIISVVGLPFLFESNIYNCAAIIFAGKILGLVPKTHLPNYFQYNEKRYFSPFFGYDEVEIAGEKIPFSKNLIFKNKNMQEFKFGVEICEDLWAPGSPALDLALAGSTIILNLSASDEQVGKLDIRKNLVNVLSRKLCCGYLYASAGLGESSTDLVYPGHSLISFMGKNLAESELFTKGFILADIDLKCLVTERAKMQHFCLKKQNFHYVSFDLKLKDLKILKNTFSKSPFLSQEKRERGKMCSEALKIQAQGLKTRILNSGIKKVVLGLSGGLDSTLALMVAAKAFKELDIKSTNITTVFLRGPGSSKNSFSSAEKLTRIFGVKFLEIPIEKALKNHLQEIDFKNNKTVFENAQARERTQILMDLANQNNALVLGTSDLSEIALGFSTYGGDHLSMYNVNATVPKTMIRAILEFEKENYSKKEQEVFSDILERPISPELLPLKEGKVEQKTEDILGPYELHDFFIYYFIRYGFSVSKLLRISCSAFENIYTKEQIKKCLKIFIQRFFQNQFKRSCMPDGPKVTEISLSPRTNFILPSDCNFEIFLKDI